MINPPLRLLATYQQEFQKEPQYLLQLDDRKMWVAAELTGSAGYTVIVPDMDVRITLDRASAKRKQTKRKRPLPKWSYYIAGVIGVVSRLGLEMEGATIVIVGDEPLGPRFEHALGMAFAVLWYQINETDYTSDTLKTILEEVRRDYVMS